MSKRHIAGAGTFDLEDFDNDMGERIAITVDYEGHIEPQDSDMAIKVTLLEGPNEGADITKELEPSAIRRIVERAYNELEGDA